MEVLCAKTHTRTCPNKASLLSWGYQTLGGMKTLWKNLFLNNQALRIYPALLTVLTRTQIGSCQLCTVSLDKLQLDFILCFLVLQIYLYFSEQEYKVIVQRPAIKINTFGECIQLLLSLTHIFHVERQKWQPDTHVYAFFNVQ